MQHFHNILFISHSVANETEALKQALSLARNNKAALKALKPDGFVSPVKAY